jgi:hypothetical protein
VPPPYRASHIEVLLTAKGIEEPRQLGYLFELAPTRVVGATIITPRRGKLYADGIWPYPVMPTAAAVGTGQGLVRGQRYELNYWPNSPKAPTRVNVSGSIARGWRLDPEDDATALLCLTDELDDEAGKSTGDYCYSIRRDGRPTGRFRATLTNPETGRRYDFKQSSELSVANTVEVAP